MREDLAAFQAGIQKLWQATLHLASADASATCPRQ
jgi:hypothetical protein